MATTTRTKPSCFFELFLFIKSLSGYCRPSGVLSINPAMAKLCPSLSSTFVLVISYCPDGPFLLLSLNNGSTVPEQPAESDSPALPAPRANVSPKSAIANTPWCLRWGCAQHSPCALILVSNFLTEGGNHGHFDSKCTCAGWSAPSGHRYPRRCDLQIRTANR